MPDEVLDREELRKFINQPNEPTPITATPTIGPTMEGPKMGQDELRRFLNIPAGSPEKPASFESRNFRGIPITDMDSPLGMRNTDLLRTQLLMRQKPEDKISFLEDIAGPGNVRLADNGEPLMIAFDKERGTPVELRVMGSGANIMPKLESMIPETAAALGTMALTKKLPLNNRFVRWAAEMAGAAIGQEAGGAAKDIAVSSTPLDEIIAERASAVPGATAASLALGAAGSAIAKVGGRIVSPFGAATGPVEAETMAARQHFLDKWNIDYPLTTGEKIGSRLFKRVEATFSREPGASENFDAIQRKKVEALRQIQAKMLSSKLDPADAGMLSKLEEDVGQEAIDTIRQNVNPVIRAEETARSTTATAANNAILEDLAQATGQARQLYPEAGGAKLRAGAFVRENQFKDEAGRLYDVAYSKPGGTDKLLEPPNLVSDAKQLLKEQPAPEVTTTSPSPIVGPTGQPIMMTTTSEIPVKEFVPETIIPMLNRLASLDRAKFSLQDLVKMRTEVRNTIKRGQALGDVKDHYLGEIEDLLSNSIKEGTDALPTSELKDAWQKANDFYAKGAPPFKDKNIAKLFRDKETGAFVQDEDLIRNIGPSEYASYKQFFGANSDEMVTLKRALVDQLLPGEELINAKQFLGNLRGFINKNRSVAEDILGPETTRRLQLVGEKMEQVQAGDIVDRNDIVNLLVSGQKNKMLSELDNLVAQQRKLNDIYKSQITKDIAEGKLGERLDATEFMNRMWDKASPKEIAAIKEQLASNPNALEDLQRKMAERVFQKTQSDAKLELTRVGAGEPFRKGSASAIENVFGSEQNKQRIRALVGDERMDDFEQLAKILRGGEGAERAFAGAGGFSAQMQIHRMFRGGVFAYLTDWLQQKMAAAIYFSKPIEPILINQVGRSPEAQAAVARSIVLSQPFMSAMKEDFGDKGSTVIDKILDSIGLYEAQGPPGKKAVSRQAWVDELIKRGDQSPNRQRVFKVE